MPLTPDEIARARAFMAKGASARAAALRAGISPYLFYCELEPDYRQRRNQANRLSRMKRRKQRLPRVKSPAFLKKYGPTVGVSVQRHLTRAVVPPEVQAERDRVSNAPRTLAMILLGDPPPGRSALDARR